MKEPTRIGLDFDNTIAGYDRIFLNAAKEANLLPEYFVGGKKKIRDAIKSRSNGEMDWMRLQGQVYGKMMPQADLIDGVAEFLINCRDRNIPVSIISHKTEFGHHDPEQINLRDMARNWMVKHGFFDQQYLGILEDDVYFESSLTKKIARIIEVHCSHFVDDLEEIFCDPSFPDNVDALLFVADTDKTPTGPFKTCQNWQEIENVILG